MKSRDKKLKICCIICGRNYEVSVNDDDYHEYKSRTLVGSTTDTEKTFPYLEDWEIDLIEVQICPNCV